MASTPSIGAVADEHDEEQVVARHGAADGVEMLADVRGRGCRRRVGRIGQHLETAAIDLHSIDEHGREIAGPRRVLRGVLLAAARAGHDERVAFAGNGRRGLCQEHEDRCGAEESDGLPAEAGSHGVSE